MSTTFINKLIIAIFAGCIFLLFPYSAQSKEVVYPNGDKYKGGWNIFKSCPQGKGTMWYANGDVYEGDWQKGHKEGAGIMTYADGSKYEGSWLADFCEGNGKMVYANGDVYVGKWKAGKKEGRGEMTYSDGGHYDGEWLSDLFDGTGTFAYANNDTYTGCWKGGLKDGEGKMTYADGSHYEGNWAEDTYNGEGEIVYANGESYKGNWTQGHRNGKGVMKHENGDVYDGEWVDDEYEGRGTLTDADGTVYQGQFKEGAYHGKGVIKYTNGDSYDGDWVRMKKDGNGRYTFADGGYYNGSFKEGKRWGLGVMKFNSGNIYDGEWVEDERNGHGVLTNPDGDTFEGLWKNGEIEAPALLSLASGERIRYYTNGYVLEKIYYGGRSNNGVLVDLPSGGQLKATLDITTPRSVMDSLYLYDAFPEKYLEFGVVSEGDEVVDYFYKQPLAKWGELIDASSIPGTWNIAPINKKSPFPIEHYRVLASERNGTESGTIKTYLYKMEYTFKNNGQGTLKAEVIGDGYAYGMTSDHYTSNGWYMGSSSTLNFFFEMTGTITAQFTWKINSRNELEMHLQSASKNVTSKPSTKGFGDCDPTYLKQFMRQLNSSYRSHPDVKKTEQIVKRNLEMIRSTVTNDYHALITDDGQLVLLNVVAPRERVSSYWVYDKN